MALTNFAALTTEQKTVWSKDMWKAARDYQFMSKFTGTGPTSMIQRITELKKTEKGARAVITLVADLEGDGVAGDRTLEGNEEAMSSSDQVIRIDQLRHAVRHEGRMADQKSVVMFRENARDTLAYWMADRMDQLGFLTLSGIAYTSKTDGATRTGSDLPNLEYAADVTVPSANRHRRWDVDTVNTLQAGSTASVVATDLPSLQMLISLKAYAQEQFLKPIRGEGNMSFYHVFMTPHGVASLKQDTDFMSAWREAMPRSPNNPIFKGTDTIWVDGLAIHTFRHVYDTQGLTSGVDKWGSGNTVDGQRVLLCGAQAMGYADIGDPEWVEKGFDYDNQQGISVGKICGLLKPQFTSQVTGTTEDFGVIACDTAIQL
jgi:N4-gp56 family major capsid protein